MPDQSVPNFTSSVIDSADAPPPPIIFRPGETPAPITPGKKGIGKKTIATILGLILLIGGVATGVILVQQRQELRKKAQDVPGNFTVEAQLDTSRFTQVKARAIIHYDVSPRVDYTSCMSQGFMGLPIRASDDPCTAVGEGSYATKWDRKVTVDGKEYRLVYPTTCVGEKINGVEVCEQTENIRPNVGAPFHRGIYQLIATFSQLDEL